MIDVIFWFLELTFRLIPSLMIKTGKIVLAALSLGFHRSGTNKSLEESDSLLTIEQPSFWGNNFLGLYWDLPKFLFGSRLKKKLRGTVGGITGLRENCLGTGLGAGKFWWKFRGLIGASHINLWLGETFDF